MLPTRSVPCLTAFHPVTVAQIPFMVLVFVAYFPVVLGTSVGDIGSWMSDAVTCLANPASSTLSVSCDSSAVVVFAVMVLTAVSRLAAAHVIRHHQGGATVSYVCLARRILRIVHRSPPPPPPPPPTLSRCRSRCCRISGPVFLSLSISTRHWVDRLCSHCVPRRMALISASLSLADVAMAAVGMGTTTLSVWQVRAGVGFHIPQSLTWITRVGYAQIVGCVLVLVALALFVTSCCVSSTTPGLRSDDVYEMPDGGKWYRPESGASAVLQQSTMWHRFLGAVPRQDSSRRTGLLADSRRSSAASSEHSGFESLGSAPEQADASYSYGVTSSHRRGGGARPVSGFHTGRRGNGLGVAGRMYSSGPWSDLSNSATRAYSSHDGAYHGGGGRSGLRSERGPSTHSGSYQPPVVHGAPLARSASVTYVSGSGLTLSTSQDPQHPTSTPADDAASSASSEPEAAGAPGGTFDPTRPTVMFS